MKKFSRSSRWVCSIPNSSSPSLGGNPRSVTAFTNVDGKVDLVSANQYNNDLSLMTNIMGSMKYFTEHSGLVLHESNV